MDSIHGDAYEMQILGKKVAIVTSPIANPLYLRYISDIVQRSTKNANSSITLINLENVNFEFRPGRILPGGSTQRAQREIFKKVATEYGDFVDFVNVDANSCPIPTKSVIGDCKKISDLGSIASYSNYLGRSIQSVLATTYIKSANPNVKLRKYRRIILELESDFLKSYFTVKNFLANNSFDTVIFLNGRWPGDAAIRLACIEAKTPYLSLEHGSPRGSSYHLEPFQTQERDLKQEFLLKKMHEFKSEEIYETSQIWPKNQSENNKQNPFVTDSRSLNLDLNGSEVVFFTSSVDENIGSPGYKNDGWPTQQDAIYELGPKLTILGFKLIVRIHPNALNKSWHDIFQLAKACRITNSICILPTSKVSTYALLDDLDKIIVWKSTLGQEASVIGKHVYLIAENDYDQMIDAVKIKPGFLDFPLKWDIDPAKSRFSICYKIRNGFPLFEFQKPDSIENFLLENEIKSKSAWENHLKWQKFNLICKLIFTPWRLTPGEALGISRQLAGTRASELLFGLLVSIGSRAT